MEMNASSLKSTARLAGLLYLVWIITGVFALFYVPSQINVQGDAVTTSQNILSNEFLFRTSIANDIFSNALWVFMVLVLYRLFKHVSGRQAKLLVALVIVQIPALFITETFNITSLMIFKGEVLETFALSQRLDLAMLFLKMNDYGSLISETFWGLWLFPLGSLVYKSRFLPRFLGVWLIINGFAYLIMSGTGLLLPQYKDALYYIALPAIFGELAFMLWLLIMGAKLPTGNPAPAP